jgi:hypothetical protein
MENHFIVAIVMYMIGVYITMFEFNFDKIIDSTNEKENDTCDVEYYYGWWFFR